TTVKGGSRYKKESNLKGLPIEDVYRETRLDLKWWILFTEPFAEDSKLLAVRRLTWNELADRLEVSDQFMTGASVFSLTKKRINGVRRQLFLRTRDWFISYFGFNEQGYLLASIMEVCVRYIVEHSYTCRVEIREGG